MTAARPLTTQPRPAGMRVVQGRRTVRPRIGAWIVYTVVAAVAFFGLIYSQTRLNARAIEINEIQQAIEVEQERFESLQLQVARLESPSLVVPAAEELGMVFPTDMVALTASGVVGTDQGAGERLAELESVLTAAP